VGLCFKDWITTGVRSVRRCLNATQNETETIRDLTLTCSPTNALVPSACVSHSFSVSSALHSRAFGHA
jgi:hypothetical protein